MTNVSANSSLRIAALVAGSALLALTVLAVGAVFFIFEKLIVPGDAGATISNILAGEFQFRIGIACLFMVAVLDLVVAWALYVFLEPVSKNLSLLAAWFRLVYSAILGVALFSYAHVLRLLGGAHYMQGEATGSLHADVMLSLNGFDDGWAIGLVFFGIHLIVLGYLVFKSGYAPSLLGIVLAVAGVAYVADSVSKFLLPHHVVELATYMGWGELLFMFWLLYKGLTSPNTSRNTAG